MEGSLSNAAVNGDSNKGDVIQTVDTSAASAPDPEGEDHTSSAQSNKASETAEFAYPQLPIKMMQQDSTLQQDSEERGGPNPWEESFDGSLAGTNTLADDLQVPCLESTRIASTPYDSEKAPLFDVEEEISRVQLPSVDLAAKKKPRETGDGENEGHADVSAISPVDAAANFSPFRTTEASPDEEEVFQSPENGGVKEKSELGQKTSHMEQSGTVTDEQKSTLNKAFVSESFQNPAENQAESQSVAEKLEDRAQNGEEALNAEDSSLESAAERSVINVEQNNTDSGASLDHASSPVPDAEVSAKDTNSSSTASNTAVTELDKVEPAVEVAVCSELEAPQQDVVDAPRLPHTVTELTGPHGVKIYLVGTAHFSLESQKDVSVTIAIAQPNVVMVELCRSRLNILHMDEEAILKEAKDINMAKIRETIRQHGAVQGALYLLFLSTSAHLTRQLGMAPGGEFRRAYNEARNVPGCTVHLGDRPIHVTLQRALGALSVWQKLKLVWHLLLSRENISPEEVERCKQRDLLEELLEEMTGEFPALSRVFVQERDLCLAHSLQIAAAAAADQQRMRQDNKGPSVVAVVGIGHVSGIVSYFGKVNESDVREVMKVPPPSRSAKVLRGVIKYGLIGLVCYGAYKVLPVPRMETLFK